jgi:UPF0755 protein
MLKKILLTVTILIFSFFIYCLTYITENIDVNGTISIPKGSASAVVASLSDQGYDVGALDRIIIKIIGGLKYGQFKLDEPNYSRIGFFYALKEAKSLQLDVTLIPGETVEIFLHQIADKHNLSFDKLKIAYYDNTELPDGVIWPDTYTFKYDIGEEALIGYLIKHSLKKHKEISQKLLKTYDEPTWFDKYVVIASIIQKEAVTKEEMPLVSSVIYNRLAKNMPLQMDGSLNYGIFSHKKITPERIRTDISTYNTYKNRGLPDYPVCAASEDALNAAVNPAKTDYLYFMRNKTGQHTFTKSFSEHNNVIQDVKKSNTHR